MTRLLPCHLTGLNWNASMYSSVRGVYVTPFFVAQIGYWNQIGMMPRSSIASFVACRSIRERLVSSACCSACSMM